MHTLESLKNTLTFESAVLRGLAKAKWMPQPIDRPNVLSEESRITGYVECGSKPEKITSYHHSSQK